MDGGLARARAGLERLSQEFQDSILSNRDSALGHARIAARQYSQEEKWHTSQGLARFAIALAHLEDESLPKVVLYFGDTLRSNPGDHFLGLVREPRHVRAGYQPSGAQARSAPTRPSPGSVQEIPNVIRLSAYDRVIDEAVANGVRLYTVEARGLSTGIAGSITSGSNITAVNSHPLASSRRRTDAQSGLKGFALETGGRAFLNGVGPAKIARSLVS